MKVELREAAAAALLPPALGKALPRASCAYGAEKFPRGTTLGVVMAPPALALLLLLLLLLQAISTGNVPTTGAKAVRERVKFKALGVAEVGCRAVKRPQGSPVRACSVR